MTDQRDRHGNAVDPADLLAEHRLDQRVLAVEPGAHQKACVSDRRHQPVGLGLSVVGLHDHADVDRAVQDAPERPEPGPLDGQPDPETLRFWRQRNPLSERRVAPSDVVVGRLSAKRSPTPQQVAFLVGDNLVAGQDLLKGAGIVASREPPVESLELEQHEVRRGLTTIEVSIEFIERVRNGCVDLEHRAWSVGQIVQQRDALDDLSVYQVWRILRRHGISLRRRRS